MGVAGNGSGRSNLGDSSNSVSGERFTSKARAVELARASPTGTYTMYPTQSQIDASANANPATSGANYVRAMMQAQQKAPAPPVNLSGGDEWSEEDMVRGLAKERAAEFSAINNSGNNSFNDGGVGTNIERDDDTINYDGMVNDYSLDLSSTDGAKRKSNDLFQ